MSDSLSSQLFSVTPPSLVERLISFISVQSGSLQRSSSGKVERLASEMQSVDWMAALSHSGDPLGEAAVVARYLGGEVPALVSLLNTWGLHRLLASGFRMSVFDHRRLSTLAARQFVSGAEVPRRFVLLASGHGKEDDRRIQGHYLNMQSRLHNGEERVLEHLRRQIA